MDIAPALTVELPPTTVDQDQEWCDVEFDGRRERIRFHDYARIYAIPGLYERLFAELLECDSPRVVADLWGARPDAGGCVLDLGAGNGMVGEELRRNGAECIVGVDLLEEAREAALRDRPGVYDAYVACDLTAPSAEATETLDDFTFDAMVCVAALGFGDIPPAAFAAAFDRVREGGAVVFNIKEDFLEDGEPSGFSRLIQRALATGVLEERTRERYVHRLATDGRPLHYWAIDTTKRGAFPASWLRA
jgi:SAM-dependent methyltransferase